MTDTPDAQLSDPDHIEARAFTRQIGAIFGAIERLVPAQHQHELTRLALLMADHFSTQLQQECLRAQRDGASISEEARARDESAYRQANTGTVLHDAMS